MTAEQQPGRAGGLRPARAQFAPRLIGESRKKKGEYGGMGVSSYWIECPQTGRLTAYGAPKKSRTARAEARKPVRSAARAAGTVWRVLWMPAEPK